MCEECGLSDAEGLAGGLAPHQRKTLEQVLPWAACPDWLSGGCSRDRVTTPLWQEGKLHGLIFTPVL